MNDNRIIDGVEYEKVLATEACVGCVGYVRHLCVVLQDDCTNAVWKEVKIMKNDVPMVNDEIKNTVDEVLDIAQNWGDGYEYSNTDRCEIKREIKVKTSPEYKEYLRLKEKFE